MSMLSAARSVTAGGASVPTTFTTRSICAGTTTNTPAFGAPGRRLFRARWRSFEPGATSAEATGAFTVDHALSAFSKSPSAASTRRRERSRKQWVTACRSSSRRDGGRCGSVSVREGHPLLNGGNSFAAGSAGHERTVYCGDERGAVAREIEIGDRTVELERGELGAGKVRTTRELGAALDR